MAQGTPRIRTLNLLKTSVGAPWAVRQVRDMVALGVDVHVALPFGGPRVAEYQAAGATVHAIQPDFPIRQPWRAPALFKELRALVADVQPDLIHSYYVGTTLTMRLALGKRHPTPRIFQVPGPLHLEHTLYRNGEIAMAGAPDYWIGTCHSIRAAYQAAGIAEERLFVSDYGVDLEDYVYHPRGKLRQEFGLSPRTTIVGMVGIMYAPKRYLGQTRGLKGHEDLIDALAICLPQYPNMVGVFVGGGWNGASAYEQRVRAYAKARCGDRAIFLGMRSDVGALLADFDIAVQPSHTEGVAATAVEAQLLDIPVVATNVGGQPDLIINGETGWLVPPHDPPQLAAAILDALRDANHTKAVAQRGRERAKRLFNGKANSRDVFEMYHTVLARAGRSNVPSLHQTLV